MEALAITPESHVVTIASGGCNVPFLSDRRSGAGSRRSISTPPIIALNRLKQVAAQKLPDYAHFRRFFGEADNKANIRAYERFIRPHLDETARRYWEGRDMMRAAAHRHVPAWRLQARAARRLHRRSASRRQALSHRPAQAARSQGHGKSSAASSKSIWRRFFDRKFVRWLTDQPALALRPSASARAI